MESLPPHARDFAEIMRQTTIEMLVMTYTLLDLEKREAGKFQPIKQKFSLAELIHQRIAYSAIAGQGRGLQIAVPEGKSVEIESDREILGRVLDNLFLNAVKFCPREKTISIQLKVGNDSFRISVANEGEPIPPEWRRRIFEPFSQQKFREFSGKKGIGLGLTFCQMAVEALGGEIQLPSPLPGRHEGMCFEAVLPK